VGSQPLGHAPATCYCCAGMQLESAQVHFANRKMNRAGGGCTTPTTTPAIILFLNSIGNPPIAYLLNSLRLAVATSGQCDKQTMPAAERKTGLLWRNHLTSETAEWRSSTVNLNGWSVAVCLADGHEMAVTSLANVTICPGRYHLVQQVSTGGMFAIPTPDSSGTS